MRQARSLERQGRIPEAISCYSSMLARWPNRASTWYNLALLQRRARQFRQALSSYQNAIQLGIAQPEEAHLNRGVIFSDDLRDYTAAERELETALRLNPVYLPALINLANLHEDLGRRDAALEVYERILALDESCVTALARYANLRTFRDPQDPLIGRLRAAVAAPGFSAADRASLGFALGRALDACGDYAGAFEAYRMANLHSRASVPPTVADYDRTLHERRIDRLIGAFPGQRRVSEASPAQPRPVFVCGMFRSGSTLVEQLLAQHPRIAPGGELDLLPHIAEDLLAPFPEAVGAATPERIAALRAEYLGSLATLFPRQEHVTDKRPDNYLYIGLIKLLLPEAKIVHTVREPLDNCLSVFFLHLDQRMSYALDLLDIGHYYVQYSRLMAHWKSRFAADIIDVRYDELVREPGRVLPELFGFLGLECPAVDRSAALGRRGPVKTASVWQVREPLYQRSSGRACHYATQLEALRAYLAAAGVVGK